MFYKNEQERARKLLSSIGKRKYYTLDNIKKNNPGCKLCQTWKKWRKSLFKDAEWTKDNCDCNLVLVAYLTKMYAEELDRIDRMYEDDGK